MFWHTFLSGTALSRHYMINLNLYLVDADYDGMDFARNARTAMHATPSLLLQQKCFALRALRCVALRA